MRANEVSLVCNVIHMGELRKFKSGENEISSLYVRIAVPGRRVKVGDSYETKQDIFDAQIIGGQADYLHTYGNNTHQDGEKKGKFIARQIFAKGRFTTYNGVVKSKAMDIEIEGVGEVELPDGYVEIPTVKVRFDIIDFDFLDYVETENSAKPPVKPKGKPKLKAKSKASDSSDKTGSPDDDLNEFEDETKESSSEESKSSEDVDTEDSNLEEELNNFELDENDSL